MKAGRSRLINEFNEIYVHFYSMDDMEKFKFIMELDDSEKCSIMSTFMNNIIKMRGSV